MPTSVAKVFVQGLSLAGPVTYKKNSYLANQSLGEYHFNPNCQMCHKEMCSNHSDLYPPEISLFFLFELIFFRSRKPICWKNEIVCTNTEKLAVTRSKKLKKDIFLSFFSSKRKIRKEKTLKFLEDE